MSGGLQTAACSRLGCPPESSADDSGGEKPKASPTQSRLQTTLAHPCNSRDGATPGPSPKASLDNFGGGRSCA
eukprot:NODE_6073_length_655_cov_4.747525_g5150_i0.p2 GENE.NODE_6073_length_655_cov_4.747525_g5150_i0~~NODE_6073_length_655_cov_4.747525_g5150_i0.p2  ORF type:complete len:73 (+),score=7.66 NODE_6073_length_655_cov_4.747525_g5150_i0:91-309(+)